MTDTLISYVPTVRWLTCERRAFQQDISADIKAKIKPLIEIPSRGEKHDEPDAQDELMNAATPEDYLRALPRNVIHHWGLTPFLLDTAFLSEAERQFGGRSSLAYLCEALNDDRAQPIPVLRLDTPATSAKDVRAHVRSGIGLRLIASELARTSDITALLKAAGATPEVTDVIVDLGFISDESFEVARALLQQPVLGRFARSREWRSVTLLGGSFPPSLTGMKAGLHVVERMEWNLWRDAIDGIERRMLFGDYTVTYPRPEPLKGDTMRGAIPCIRYTADTNWLLFRGLGKKEANAAGNKQYHELARRCREHDAYRKPGYSKGDLFIDKCADEDAGPGNPTTWRRVATSTHVTFVANQAASAYDSANGL